MCIQDRFAPLLARCSQLVVAGENTDHQVTAILAESDGFLAELPDIYEAVQPCFPPSYDAFGFLVGEYRGHLLSMLDFVGLCSSNLANEDILKVVSWVCRATDALRALGLGEEESALGTPGLEHNGVSLLIERYVERVSSTLSTWLGNIVRDDYSGKPKISSEGRAWTPGPIDFFRILHEQLGLVASVDSDGALALAVGRAALAAMKNYQAAQTEAVGRREHLGLEMLAAAVNNSVRCREEGLRFAERVRGNLSRRLRQALDFEGACEAYWVVTRQAVAAVTRLIFSDPGMMALVLQLGCSPAWQAGTCLGSILATVEDYLGDLNILIQPQAIDKLMEAIMEETVALYCAALLCFVTQIGDDEAAAVRRDQGRILEFFSRHLQPAKVKKLFVWRA